MLKLFRVLENLSDRYVNRRSKLDIRITSKNSSWLFCWKSAKFESETIKRTATIKIDITLMTNAMDKYCFFNIFPMMNSYAYRLCSSFYISPFFFDKFNHACLTLRLSCGRPARSVASRQLEPVVRLYFTYYLIIIINGIRMAKINIENRAILIRQERIHLSLSFKYLSLNPISFHSPGFSSFILMLKS